MRNATRNLDSETREDQVAARLNAAANRVNSNIAKKASDDAKTWSDRARHRCLAQALRKYYWDPLWKPESGSTRGPLARSVEKMKLRWAAQRSIEALLYLIEMFHSLLPGEDLIRAVNVGL